MRPIGNLTCVHPQREREREEEEEGEKEGWRAGKSLLLTWPGPVFISTSGHASLHVMSRAIIARGRSLADLYLTFDLSSS